MPLYAASGGNAASDLWTINTTTGVATSVGSTGIAITGLAFDPTDGTLYAVTSNNSPGSTQRRLYTIDPSDGTATFIGSLGVSQPVTDISFAADGTLYGIRSNAPDNILVTINKATGAATVVGPAGWGGGLQGGAIALDATDYPVISLEESGGPIQTADLGTGAITSVTALTFPDDLPQTDEPIPAASVGTDGLVWAWVQKFDSEIPLIKFGLDGTTELVVMVSQDEGNWDALAWSEAPGTLTEPTPCANDAFEDAFALELDVGQCCTMWGATNTAENAAFGPGTFTAPVTWYTFQPAADMEALFANGANPAVQLRVYEDDPGVDLTTLGSTGTLVATTAASTFDAVNVLAAKEYYIAVTGYGDFTLEVYTGADYPQTYREDLGSTGTPILFGPNTNHDYIISNAVIGPDGDVLLAVLDVDFSGGVANETSSLDLYSFDGVSFTYVETLDTWSYTDVPTPGTPGVGEWSGGSSGEVPSLFSGGGSFITEQGKPSIALATDGTTVWVAAGVYEFECWTDRPTVMTSRGRLKIYEAGGGGLIHTEEGVVYGVFSDGTITTQHLSGYGVVPLIVGNYYTFYAGCGGTIPVRVVSNGEVRGASAPGLGRAYFGFAEAGPLSPPGVSVGASGDSDYLGRIIVADTDGTSYVPYSNDPLAGATFLSWTWGMTEPTYTVTDGFDNCMRQGWRQDFDLVVNADGDVVAFVADGDEPGSDSGDTPPGSDTWDVMMQSAAGATLQTIPIRFAGSDRKVMYPKSSALFDGNFYVVVTEGNGLDSGGAPCISSQGGVPYVYRVAADGSSAPVFVNQVSTSAGMNGGVFMRGGTGLDATEMYVISSNTSYSIGFGGQAASNLSRASHLYDCYPQDGLFTIDETNRQIGNAGSGTSASNLDARAFYMLTGIVFDGALWSFGVRASTSTTDALAIEADHAAILSGSSAVACPRVVPLPECVPPQLIGIDMTSLIFRLG